MPDAHRIGAAWAWQDGERWLYLTEPYFAPDEAVQCEVIDLVGEKILHLTTGHSGEIIRGAVDARDARHEG